MNKEKKVAFIIFACFFLISSVALLIWDTKTGDEKDFFLPREYTISSVNNINNSLSIRIISDELPEKSKLESPKLEDVYFYYNGVSND